MFILLLLFLVMNAALLGFISPVFALAVLCAIVAYISWLTLHTIAMVGHAAQSYSAAHSG